MNFRFDEEIILENKDVLLRPLILADIDNLLGIAIANPRLLQYSPKQIYSKELLTEYVEDAMRMRANRTRYSFSIFYKPGNCYAGSTAFLNISNADDSIEIGATWLDPKLHGAGLNRQCKHLLLSHAFNIQGAHRVEFRTDERNARSRKALKKIGASFEGFLRENMMMSDGFRRSTCYFSILKHEWEMMKGNFLSA